MQTQGVPSNSFVWGKIENTTTIPTLPHHKFFYLVSRTHNLYLVSTISSNPTIDTPTTSSQYLTMPSAKNNPTSPSGSARSSMSSPSKAVKQLQGLVKSGLAFRKNKKAAKSKKTKRTDDTATTTTKSSDTKPLFLVEDSNSETTEEVNMHDVEDSADEASAIDLVVLLMHPISHRFELLQLEFDEAQKAKVSDLLAQIPISVTEDRLKDQLYDAILDESSTDPSRSLVLKSTKLVDAFKGTKQKSKTGTRKMVLVARPQGLSNADTLKMAKPIFTNKDISSMVRTAVLLFEQTT